jgi:hypothetical protein
MRAWTTRTPSCRNLAYCPGINAHDRHKSIGLPAFFLLPTYGYHGSCEAFLVSQQDFSEIWQQIERVTSVMTNGFLISGYHNLRYRRVGVGADSGVHIFPCFWFWAEDEWKQE